MQQSGYALLNPIALGVAIAIVELLVALVMLPMMAMMPMMRDMPMQMSPVVGLLGAIVGGFVIGAAVAWIYNAVVRRMAPSSSSKS